MCLWNNFDVANPELDCGVPSPELYDEDTHCNANDRLRVVFQIRDEGIFPPLPCHLRFLPLLCSWVTGP